MTAYTELTSSQQAALIRLGDGGWRRGSSTSHSFRVISGPACVLVQLGLAERRGSSRTAKPSNPGYEYRITAAGRTVLEAESARILGGS